eukprot:TRINITY_DN13776_c0_g1_i2.p1 TRINITY_DN13776_c0_g1~~TRINITY_DN13776_c0_g1_i2.p1  ORF type:complete len:420 (-),score=41.82 TRINITY_DN13776_c0_g1_i2:97-1356(-)
MKQEGCPAKRIIDVHKYDENERIQVRHIGEHTHPQGHQRTRTEDSRSLVLQSQNDYAISTEDSASISMGNRSLTFPLYGGDLPTIETFLAATESMNLVKRVREISQQGGNSMILDNSLGSALFSQDPDTGVNGVENLLSKPRTLSPLYHHVSEVGGARSVDQEEGFRTHNLLSQTDSGSASCGLVLSSSCPHIPSLARVGSSGNESWYNSIFSRQFSVASDQAQSSSSEISGLQFLEEEDPERWTKFVQESAQITEFLSMETWPSKLNNFSSFVSHSASAQSASPDIIPASSDQENFNSNVNDWTICHPSDAAVQIEGNIPYSARKEQEPTPILACKPENLKPGYSLRILDSYSGMKSLSKETITLDKNRRSHCTGGTDYNAIQNAEVIDPLSTLEGGQGLRLSDFFMMADRLLQDQNQ